MSLVEFAFDKKRRVGRHPPKSESPRTPAARIIVSAYSPRVRLVNVYEIRKYRVGIGGAHRSDEVRHDVSICVSIIRVEDANDVASRQPDAFIHCVVDSTIRLRHKAADPLLVRLNQLHRSVRRASVDDDVLNRTVILRQNRIDRFADCPGTVETNRDDRYFWIAWGLVHQ